MEDGKLRAKRGRPRKDYSEYIGSEGPLGLRIESIIDEGKRTREGPHVVAVCSLCGERSTPRLRDVLRGHSRSGGCRKKQCFLEFCDLAASRLSESVVAGVWAARYCGDARKATASRFKLRPPIADAALRRYQSKLDGMLQDGKAEKIYHLVSQPGRSFQKVAADFELPLTAVRYLTLAAFNRARRVQAALNESNAQVSNSIDSTMSIPQPVEHDEIWWCACLSWIIVDHVGKRQGPWAKTWPPGELGKDDLRRRGGKLVGSLADLYHQAKSFLTSENLPIKYREDIEMFVDLADRTLANRQGRQLRAAREHAGKNKAFSP